MLLFWSKALWFSKMGYSLQVMRKGWKCNHIPLQGLCFVRFAFKLELKMLECLLYPMHIFLTLNSNPNHKPGEVQWGGGRGGKKKTQNIKKGESKKCGIFSCIIKISFSVIFNKKIHALSGRASITTLALKRHQLSPAKGSALWTPKVTSPPQWFTLLPPLP